MEEATANKIHILEPKEEEDSISLLPEVILHKILCSLSQKEAIKTCVLSKAWRYLGCTRPIIKFSRRKYWNSAFAERLLQAYHDLNLRLDEFTLLLSEMYVDTAASFLHKWIPIIIHDMRVQKFHLSLKPGSQEVLFELPSLIFESQDIRCLLLRSCVVLRSATTTQLRVDLNLKVLRLKKVDIPEEILGSILSNCPFLEDLNISDSKGFKRIKLMNSKLKAFSFHVNDDGSHRHVSIEIGNEIQTLTSIKLDHCLLSVSRNKPLEFPHLKRLSLSWVQLSLSLSCNLHSLEELMLDQCYGIKEFKLSSRSMKRLFIQNICRPFKATIDAPSMVSFYYLGVLPQSISFPTTSSDDHFWRSEIILESSTYAHCFNELYGLLKALSQSEISLAFDEIDIRRFQSQLPTNIDDIVGSVSEEAKHELPVVVELLTIMRSERNVNSNAGAAFLNMLFRMFRPRFVCMGMDMLINSNDQFREIAELLFRERGTVQSEFWQSVLEVVSLKVLHHRSQSEWQREYWQPVERTSFTQLCKEAADTIELEIGFHLKWRD